MNEPRNRDLRAGLVAQLRELIALLESTPGLPVGEFGTTNVTYHAGSAEAVDEAARKLGVTPEWNEERSHYRTTRRIGPNVSYEALFITSEHQAAYERHMAGFHHGDSAPAEDETSEEPQA